MVKKLADAEDYLHSIQIPLRLACRTKSGWPMQVSLWFLYADGKLMCATQKTARVIEYLQNDLRCAFEISSDIPPYCGIRGQAIASINEDLGAEVLEQLLVKYLGGTDSPLAKNLLSKRDTEVAILLEPKRLFSWDFSNRMNDITIQHQMEKICP